MTFSFTVRLFTTLFASDSLMIYPFCPGAGGDVVREKIIPMFAENCTKTEEKYEKQHKINM